MRLEGQVAIITGGASGIGAGTVRRFVEEGAKVLVSDLDEERGSALVDELGDSTAFLRTDVSQEDQVAAMIDEATDRWGRLDCLFNNAGFGGALGPIESTSVLDYDLTMDVLLKSVFLGMKYAAPVMKAQGSGSIISTASVAGLRPGYAPHLYSVAKCGVIHLTKSVALELGENNIRVNCICPGFIATPLAAGRPDADDSQIQQMRDAGEGSQVLGRVGEPRDIANAALWLASDESEWVTGREMVIDGGFDAGRPWSKWPAFARMERPIRHHRPPGR
ncbi:MAG: NAD(P)-dependent dehydrogenase (short-subunit alcohol dehydrogenase family) [Candidatus Poriferisodalaceae bacterium]|jgi:NAD(P)-dependent dehydrogenase (short-subunit alcohol dehydrogenase family)